MTPALTRRLVLEAPVRLADGAGGFSTVWQALGTLWAEVVAGVGREVAVADQVQSVTAYRVTVRAAPPGSPARPRPDQRFREGGRIFTILAVAEHDPQARHLVCTVREEVPV